MDVSKTSDHIQIKIKITNPSQETSAPTKAPYQDLKDMDVLCIFKIKMESQNLDHGCIQDQWPYPNQDQDSKPQSRTSSILQNPKWWLKGHRCSLHFQNHFRQLKFRKLVYQRTLAMILEYWRILSFSEKIKSEWNSNLTAEFPWANPSWVNLAS